MAILLVALGHPAYAADPLDESSHWVPSVALFFDALGQKASGSLTSGTVLGAPLSPFDAEQDAFADGTGCLQRSGNPPANPFVYTRSGALCPSARPDRAKIMADAEGSDTSVSPLVGASLELMTPSPFGDIWLRPRVFVHGDIAAAFSYERNLAGTEAPGEFQLPPGNIIPPGIPPDNVDLQELSVRGQGTRARIQLRRWVYSAGGGLALSLDVLNRRVRVKPSFEYLHQELDLIGVVHRAVKLKIPTGAGDLSGFRQLSLTAVEQRSYDGIGPGLELEIDTARLGPFVSSIYMMGRGYYLFGDLETMLSATNEFGETASWTIEPDSWAWRGGVGFRFRWLPERD